MYPKGVFSQSVGEGEEHVGVGKVKTALGLLGRHLKGLHITTSTKLGTSDIRSVLTGLTPSQ